MPTSVIGFVTEVAPTRTSPELRLSRPATMSMSVLLPQPEGPTTETNAPAPISALIGFNARNGLSVSTPKVFETPRMLMGTPDFMPLFASPHLRDRRQVIVGVIALGVLPGRQQLD